MFIIIFPPRTVEEEAVLGIGVHKMLKKGSNNDASLHAALIEKIMDEPFCEEPGEITDRVSIYFSALIGFRFWGFLTKNDLFSTFLKIFRSYKYLIEKCWNFAIKFWAFSKSKRRRNSKEALFSESARKQWKSCIKPNGKFLNLNFGAPYRERESIKK